MNGSGVGFSPHRGGGRDRVTGHQAYLADLTVPDMLHAKLVRLEVARARITGFDATAAGAVPGVRLIWTADDLPQPVPRFGPTDNDRPLLAVGETKYHGEPVAIVAAETLDAAEAAARLLEVQFEEIAGGVYRVADALDPESPLVQDPELRPEDPLAGTNIRYEHNFGWGDVDAASADLVVDNTYEYPMTTHFAIEPHGFMAAPDGDGIKVWSTIQHPYWLQKILARMLDLPLSKVRVIAPDLGGGFGGKQHPKHEPLLAHLALHLQRPVRLVLTLDETFQEVRRESAEVRVRTGLMQDGTLAFEDFEINFLGGAYVDITDRVVTKSSYFAAGPYRVPGVRILARTLLSHTSPATAFRGFGVPQITWGRESNLDEAAAALGIDRIELRLKNLADFQEEFIPGDTPADGDWKQTVARAAELIEWDTPLPPGRGRGFALGIKSGPTTGLSYATVRLLADGSAMLLCGTSDMGQGARTVFAQIVAQELGIDFDRVRVIMGDTAVVPYDQQTSASRSSVLMGTAVLRACRDLLSKVKKMAEDQSGDDDPDITIEDGVVHFPDDTKASVTEVAQQGLGLLGGEIVGNGEKRKDKVPGHPLSGSAAFFEFNATACEVEVDPETGETVIHRFVTVGDVGKALNPNQVHGQDDGAAIMGIGHTMMEHYIYDDAGRVRNLGAIDYRVPTIKDLPLEFISASIENEDGPGPYGAKGISEGSLLAVAPALGAAVRQSAGIEIRDLPLSPERVWRAIKEQR